jgi:hypothetical protein
MPMTLSGDGTITGLVAGGLPNATVIDADLSLTANSAQVMVALNASGSAPIYACRAWVNFNGTGTVAIRASGNVSSITDNATGDYTVNFTTAMQDANYAICLGVGNGTSGTAQLAIENGGVYSTAAVRIQGYRTETGTDVDMAFCSVSIFR